jgi:hypothetical protein
MKKSTPSRIVEHFRKSVQALLIGLVLLIGLAGVPGCGDDTPTGVDREDLEGVWSGQLVDVTLMGRSLSGDIDWRFTRSNFEIAFINPPLGGTERIGGDWKFHDEKVVLELKTSFPIQDDIGATDTLFVSILDDELSIQTIGGSSILLRKTGVVLVPGGPHKATLCRSEAPSLLRPSASISLRSHSARLCCRGCSPARRSRPESSTT